MILRGNLLRSSGVLLTFLEDVERIFVKLVTGCSRRRLAALLRIVMPDLLPPS
jgi:hypothetical protein